MKTEDYKLMQNKSCDKPNNIQYNNQRLNSVSCLNVSLLNQQNSLCRHTLYCKMWLTMVLLDQTARIIADTLGTWVFILEHDMIKTFRLINVPISFINQSGLPICSFDMNTGRNKNFWSFFYLSPCFAKLDLLGWQHIL